MSIETKPLIAGQAIVNGRILEVYRPDAGGVFTTITLPAPDAYSSPANVSVRSDRMIGKPHEDVSVKVRIAGYRRSFKDRNGETQYITENQLFLID